MEQTPSNILQDFEKTFKGLKPGEEKTITFDIKPGSNIDSSMNEMARTARTLELTDDWEKSFDENYNKRDKEKVRTALNSLDQTFTPAQFGEKVGYKSSPQWNTAVKSLYNGGVLKISGETTSSPTSTKQTQKTKTKVMNKGSKVSQKFLGTRDLGELAEGAAVISLRRLLKSQEIETIIDWDNISTTFNKLKQNILSKTEQLPEDQQKQAKQMVLDEIKTGKNLAESFLKQIEENVKDKEFITVKIDWEGGLGEKTDVKLTISKKDTDEIENEFRNSIKTGKQSRINGTDAGNIGVYLYNWFAPEKLDPSLKQKGGRYNWKKYFGSENSIYDKIANDIPEFKEFAKYRKEEEQLTQGIKKSKLSTQQIQQLKELKPKAMKAFVDGLNKAFKKTNSKINLLSQQGMGGDYDFFAAVKDRDSKIISKYTSPTFAKALIDFAKGLNVEVRKKSDSILEIVTNGIPLFEIQLHRTSSSFDAQLYLTNPNF